jgi:hypothetical protein
VITARIALLRETRLLVSFSNALVFIFWCLLFVVCFCLLLICDASISRVPKRPCNKIPLVTDLCVSRCLFGIFETPLVGVVFMRGTMRRQHPRCERLCYLREHISQA